MPPLMTLVALLACTGEPEPDPRVETVVLPTLRVDSPARAAFVPGSAQTLTVSGQATAGTHDLDRLFYGEQEIPLDAQGGFSFEIRPTPGINLLGLRVEDTAGERAVTGQSFHYAGDHAPDALIRDAVHLRVGPELLDDDSDDLDDIAAILEVVIEDPGLADSVVGTRVVTEDYELEVTGFSLRSADLDLDPRVGRLEVDARLTDVELEFDVFGVGWYSWLSTSGTATASSTQVLLDLVPQGGTEVSAQDVSTTIHGFDLEISLVPEALEDAIQGDAEATLEDSISEQVESLTGDLMNEYLGSYGVTQAFGDATLELSVASLDIDTWGLLLTLDAVASGFTAGLPDKAGSLLTTDAAPDWPIDHSVPFAVAIDDDFLNQLVFALWTTGALRLEFGPVEMAVLAGGSPLPPPLGPAESVVLDIQLPPVFRPGDEEHGMKLQIGELLLDITREDGERIACSLNVEAGGELVSGAEGLGVELDDRPVWVRVEAGVLAAPEGLDPGDLASLFRLMTPTLLGSAAGFMPEVALPGIPLDSFGDLAELEGKELLLVEPSASLDSSGWLIVGGQVELVQR